MAIYVHAAVKTVRSIHMSYWSMGRIEQIIQQDSRNSFENSMANHRNTSLEKENVKYHYLNAGKDSLNLSNGSSTS